MDSRFRGNDGKGAIKLDYAKDTSAQTNASQAAASRSQAVSSTASAAA